MYRLHKKSLEKVTLGLENFKIEDRHEVKIQLPKCLFY